MTQGRAEALTVLQLIHGMKLGGAEKVVRHIAGGLRDEGLRPVVCGWYTGGDQADLLAAEGVTIAPPLADPHGWRRLLVPRHLHRIVEAQGVGLIHAHMSDSAVWALLLHWLSGRPFVITHHNANLIDAIVTRSPLYRWLRHALVHVCARRADLNIAVSETVRQVLIEEAGLTPDQVRFVPNGVPLPPDATVQAARQRRLERAAAGFAAQEPGPVVLYMGRFVAQKTLGVLMEAIPALLSRFPRARVVLLGEGPDGAALKAQAETLGIAAATDWPGRVDDVTPWLENADLLVLPSRVEGLPMVVLEAMAWGLPVVASDIPSNRELVGDDAFGRLSRQGDPADLARATIATLEAPEETDARVEGALALIRENYSIAAVARMHIEVYESVLQRRARKSGTSGG